ncbi:hypothetical protein [Natribacillus halophilus]|uniref:Uncharacterized protein n=1 Tax=Natribacillus halophilus TaxID=549003 RepID=A0A1G8LFQ7_9BACI|nr:hypothetical protein [Natribacillus halophilus]SDI54337.1 hypothetical protein SAMN04488123_10359 [Natribacillus halophilus]
MTRNLCISLTSILFLLSACAPDADIGHVEDESEIMIFSEEEETSIAFNALMTNHSERPSDELTINWEIDDEALLDMFSEPEVTESASESFSVGGGERFMISESFFLDETPDPEDVSGAVGGIVTNEDDEEVYRFTFENVEEV